MLERAILLSLSDGAGEFVPTILVTGAAGFIGSHLVKHFSATGIRVVALDAQSVPADIAAISARVERMQLPSGALVGLLAEEKPDFCVHCAGGSSVGYSVEYPEADFLSHVPPTYNLLNALREAAPTCKTVYLSSAAVYGDPETLPISESAPIRPLSPYGYHKVICENICGQFHELYGLRVAVVRIFSAYGAGLKKQLLWDIFRKAQATGSLELQGAGDETRDFIHVTDICRAIELVFAKADFTADSYNLGSGDQTTIRTVAKMALSALASQGKPTFSGKVRQGDPKHWQAAVSKLTGLGYEAQMPLEIGVKEYMNWCHGQTS